MTQNKTPAAKAPDADRVDAAERERLEMEWLGEPAPDRAAPPPACAEAPEGELPQSVTGRYARTQRLRAEKSEAEVARLTHALEQAQRERDDLRVVADMHKDAAARSRVEVDRLTEALAAEKLWNALRKSAPGDQQAGALWMLREALEPFARMADAYDPDEGDGLELAWDKRPTIGQLRQARAALAASAPEGATEQTHE